MTDAWSMDAFIARLELHPEFKEIYVEGESDVGLYQWFLREHGRKDVLVYPVSAISVTREIRSQYTPASLEQESRRTDVIVLALLLEDNANFASSRITCIADADTQHIFPIRVESSFLAWTDYTSVEMYAYRRDFISKILLVGSPKILMTGQQVLDSITGVLEALFSLRAANHRLSWGLSWIGFDKELTLHDADLQFDEAAYARKYLNTNGKFNMAEQFWREVKYVRDSFSPDPRLQIRGHDFLDLLCWYLRRLSYKTYRHFSAEILRHILFSQLQASDLASEGLFANLLQKY